MRTGSTLGRGFSVSLHEVCALFLTITLTLTLPLTLTLALSRTRPCTRWATTPYPSP